MAERRRARREAMGRLPSLMLVVVLALVACGDSGWSAAISTPAGPSATPTTTPTRTPEPIIPTPTPTLEATWTSTPRPSRTPTRTLTATPTPGITVTATVSPAGTVEATPMVTVEVTGTLVPDATETATLEPTETAPPAPSAPDQIPASGDLVVPEGERSRLGVSLPTWRGNPAVLDALRVGWVMDWAARYDNPYGAGVTHAQTVRMRLDQLSHDPATLTAMAAARPGSTWLISNEPDVRWQDDVTPEAYAHLYRQAYEAIKAGDGSAVVAAGGIAQPSELRLAYLDRALAEYQNTFGHALPADAWHIHNYMLREERDSWGVDIPPGMAQDTGLLYGIGDSGNLEIFRAQIVRFRQWMLDRGHGGKPLLISEFGIPMPADYGFPAETVTTFLRETTRFFLTATDPVLGNPSDGGRLVQRWCWFSIEYGDYPTGDLLEGEANRWTTLGYAWLDMVTD